jgi:hypothetical protein
MTDAQWALLRPQAQAAMAELRRSPAGRPMEHDLRAVLDAIGYVIRVDRLRGQLRTAWGRSELPTAGSIDSQSVKAADTIDATTRGYDAGKRINGRKRYLVVDSLGLLLTVIVTAASVQDRDAAFGLPGPAA